MTLADKTLAYFLVLISLMASFGVSYPGQVVQLLELALKFDFCSFDGAVEKILQEKKYLLRIFLSVKLIQLLISYL